MHLIVHNTTVVAAWLIASTASRRDSGRVLSEIAVAIVTMIINSQEH